MQHSSLASWLEERCRDEGLSLRQVAEKTGLSHTTIADIKGGVKVTADTIKKLAGGFGGNGHQGKALVDELLTFAGYRSESGEEIKEPVGRLLDKISQFSEPQLKIMESFADFITGVGRGSDGKGK